MNKDITDLRHFFLITELYCAINSLLIMSSAANQMGKRERGQYAAQVGSRYELFCAARALLSLKGNELFSLASAEDFVITSGSTTVYHQAKFSTTDPLSPDAVRNAVQKWLDSYGQAPSARFILHTNTALTTATNLHSLFLDDVAERVTVESLSTQLTDAAAVLQSHIVNLICAEFPQIDAQLIKTHLNTEELETSVTRLLSFVSQLDFKSSVGRRDILQVLSIPTILERVYGRIFGGSIHLWRDVLDASACAEHPLHQVVESIQRGQYSTRALDQMLLERARTCLKSKARRCFIVEGEQHAGKTWLLTQLATNLAHESTLYWCSNPDEVRFEGLPEAFDNHTPVLLIIDDMTSEDTVISLRRMLSSTRSVCVIATFNPTHDIGDEIETLRRRFQSIVELFRIQAPSKETIDDMSLRLRRGVSSTREKRQGGFSTIGFTARVLGGDSAVHANIQQLIDAIDNPLPSALGCIILSSSVLVHLPVSLIDYESIKHNQMIHISELVSDKFASLIFPDFAVVALRTVQSRAGTEFVATKLNKILQLIISNAEPANPTHRRVLCRLICHVDKLWPLAIERLFPTAGIQLKKCIDLEPKSCIAAFWFPILTKYCKGYAMQIAELLLNRQCEAVADVVFALTLFGGAETRKRLMATLGERWTNDIQGWASYVERVARLPREERRSTTRMLLEIVRNSQINVIDLLGLRNTAQLFTSGVISFGSHHDRVWFSSILSTLLMADSSLAARADLITLWLKLQKRCLVGNRVALARRIQNYLFGPTRFIPNTAQLWDEYSRLRLQEMGSREHFIISERVKMQAKKLASQPSAANLVWSAYLSFVRNWLEPEDRLAAWHEGFAFIQQQIENGTPFESVHGTVHELLFTARSLAPNIEPSQVKVLLRPKPALNFSIKGPGGYLVALIAFVSYHIHRDEYGAEAKNVIRKSIIEPQHCAKVLYDFCKMNINEDSVIETTGPAILGAHLNDTVAEILLYQAARCEWKSEEKSELQTAIPALYRQFPKVWKEAAAALLRLGAPAPALDIVRKHGINPDGVMLKICCLSEMSKRYDACNEFKAYLMRLKHSEEEGAHPAYIARALEHLGRRVEREERDACMIAAALTRGTLLPSREEIIKKATRGPH